MGIPQWLSGKESACSTRAPGDAGSVPGSGQSSRGGNGNPFQYSFLGNPTDRGAWRATVQMVAKSWTRLSGSTQHHRLSNALGKKFWHTHLCSRVNKFIRFSVRRGKKRVSVKAEKRNQRDPRQAPRCHRPGGLPGGKVTELAAPLRLQGGEGTQPERTVPTVQGQGRAGRVNGPPRDARPSQPESC